MVVVGRQEDIDRSLLVFLPSPPNSVHTRTARIFQKMKTAEPLPCLAGVSRAEGASVSEAKILGELSYLLNQSSELDKHSPTVVAHRTARICGASTSLTMIDDLAFLDERKKHLVSYASRYIY